MIGKTISHYKITEKLGEGGMGVVYKAHDTSLNRQVALKFLPSHLTKDEPTRKRFVVEAQAASAMDHPNICTIHAIDETTDGQQYICMAYYQGESLRQKIKTGPIPFEEVLNIFIQLAQGLKMAHDINIIHRDIKPGNIFFTERGEAKILDFGLAKLAGIDLTKSTSSKGTAAYMCPEQIRGQKVDHRCDIWALGIVLYEMLTGHLPFVGEYPEPLMYAIVSEEPRPLSHYLKDFPELLQEIIDNLLIKDPKKRYQDISNVLDDLELLVNEDKSAIKTKSDIIKILTRKKIYRSELNEEKKIAVIPMANKMEDAAQDWITEGMTDALITRMAQIGGLRVISRNSSIKYKGTSMVPPEIAMELGIKYLIEVSAVKIDDRIKVAARLIDAPSDEYIWAEEYEREFRSILGIQSEISKSIAIQTQAKLTSQEQSRLDADLLANTKTYELYLKGMFHLNKYTTEGVTRGFEYLNKAIDIDPTDPLAYAGLAIGYNIIAHAPSPPADALSKAKEAAIKALELDESQAEANLALAMIKIYNDWDIAGAEEAYYKALEYNPSLALAHAHYGWLLHLKGNFEGGHAEMDKAQQLDPRNPEHAADRSCMYYNGGHFDEAIAVGEESLKSFPDFPMNLCYLGFAYAAKGMYGQAIKVHQKAGGLNPDWKWGLGTSYALSGQTKKALQIARELENKVNVWDTFGLADIYTSLGDKDQAFLWLENAYQQRHPFIQWIRRFRNFRSLMDDSRFIDLSKRLNLPE